MSTAGKLPAPQAVTLVGGEPCVQDGVGAWPFPVAKMPW